MFLLNFVKFCSPKILYDHDFQNALISLLNYITVTKQNMTIINGRQLFENLECLFMGHFTLFGTHQQIKTNN